MANVDDRIVEMVREHWSSAQRPLLLANLGANLRREFSVEELENALLGARLRQYVTVSLADKVRVVADPKDPLVWALVPADVTLSPAELFPAREPTRPYRVGPTTGEVANNSHERVLYDPELWRAFTDINPKGRRYIQFAGTKLSYLQVPEGESPPSDAVGVDESQVPDRSPDRSVWINNATGAIEAWAKQNQINLTAFKRVIPRSAKTILEIFLDAVPSDEHKTTTLSLSVIRALMRPIP
jgi:hypothetical protein